VFTGVSIASLLIVVPMSHAHAANPAGFSVVGIRLYMTSQQVLDALNVRNTRNVHVIQAGCYRDVATAIAHAKDPRQLTIDPHCIGAIRTATTQVAFIEDYPLHPGTMRAYQFQMSSLNR
jgi:succinyl-CoA synthetase alpha subunit